MSSEEYTGWQAYAQYREREQQRKGRPRPHPDRPKRDGDDEVRRNELLPDHLFE